MKPAASLDTSDQIKRHVGDILLRRHGFRIHDRPESGSATWERGGVIVTEEVARDIAEREPKAATPAK